MARLLASDIEAKGFYNRVKTKDDIHCFCSIDVDSDEVFLFHDYPHFDGVTVLDPFDNREYVIPARKGSLQDGLEWWESEAKAGSTLIIHNAHTYDRIIINKIWPNNQIPFESYHDTFIQSKVQWFERPCPRGAKSAHGLKAYGIKLGINKPEIEDWEDMDAFKLHRVIEDCKIQAGCYKMLQKEREYLLNTFGMDFTQALKIEALYANECALQEIAGIKADVAHINRCIIDLDQKIELLRQEIEPQLPYQISCPSEKISRSAMAKLLGAKKIPQDRMVQKKQDGEIVSVVEKPYHKPTLNWTVTEKANKYSAFNISYGVTPSFTKKKDLTDYLKATYGKEYKAAEWEITKDLVETTLVNKYYCAWFGIEPDSDIIAGAFTRIEVKPTSLTQSDVVKKFLITLGWKHAEEWNLKKDMFGDYVKAEYDMEVRWPEDALPEHQLVRKIKKGGLIVSTPKLSESDYEQLPDGVGKKIAEYNTYQHRRRFLDNPKDDEKGLLAYVDERGRVPAGVNNFNTRSGRSSHRVVVNVPSVKALYGEEMRSCFIADEGKVLVGADQKSSQLSIAAYFANNVEYYNAVASGNETDENGNYIGQTAHCVNARMFNMVSQEEYELALKTQDPVLLKSISIRRSKSKPISFSIIFGAGAKKVATTMGASEKDGAAARDSFLKQMGLDVVMQTLSKYHNTNRYKGGWFLPLGFGYYLWNNAPHKDVNTVVQGLEALAQKLARIRAGKQIKDLGYEGRITLVLCYQDECLAECDPELADVTGKILSDSYTWAALQIYNHHKKNPQFFPNVTAPKFAIDLSGGYKVGRSYYEVH